MGSRNILGTDTSMIVSKFFGRSLITPSKGMCHPNSNLIGDFIVIGVVVTPARAPNHHVTEVNCPFSGAEMFYNFLGDGRRKNATHGW